MFYQHYMSNYQGIYDQYYNMQNPPPGMNHPQELAAEPESEGHKKRRNRRKKPVQPTQQ